MASVKERIAALESYVKGVQPGITTFLLEDGTEFHTPMGAFEYLYKYGAVTPTGKRIAFYPHSVDGVDGLSNRTATFKGLASSMIGLQKRCPDRHRSLITQSLRHQTMPDKQLRPAKANVLWRKWRKKFLLLWGRLERALKLLPKAH